MLFLGAVFGMMAISQASNIAQSMVGMTPAAAAIVVSVLALFNTFGRILCGYISDRIGRINTLTGVLCLAIAALGMLYFSEGSVVLFYIGICMIGVCFGAFMAYTPVSLPVSSAPEIPASTMQSCLSASLQLVSQVR